MCIITRFSQCQSISQTVVVDVVDPPVCEVAQPVVEGRNAILMCRMTYDWQARGRLFNTLPKLNVSLTWTDTSGTTVKTMTTTADRTTFSATIESNMTIENAMLPTIPSYRCTIQFDFSNGNNPYIQYAVNSVSSQPCVTQPTSVWCKYSICLS